MTTPIAVGLSAVIVAADGKAPYALTTRHADGAAGLPHGRFDPKGHRTFELGLRDWVRAQTGFEPGYVEQLYTFGDLGRERTNVVALAAVPGGRAGGNLGRQHARASGERSQPTRLARLRLRRVRKP